VSIPLRGFIQVALVVEDIERALDSWCALFEIPRPEVRVTGPDANPHEKYRGETAAYGLKVAYFEVPDHGFIIELHEPDQRPSTFREFLDKHGNGVHHLGFEVGDARDSVVAGLEAAGCPVRNLGMSSGGTWTIIDSEDSLGVNLNIKPHLF
jgi:catechol 2,3-dioxygenase-like lactoylglutathione lyase family enzyme